MGGDAGCGVFWLVEGEDAGFEAGWEYHFVTGLRLNR
jgi:hypothetical protein